MDFFIGFCRSCMVVLNYTQRFAAWRRWRFSARTFIRSTKVYIPTKLSYEARNRHFCQTAVTCWPSVHRFAVCIVNVEFPCHCLLCLSGCVSVYFYFFEALGNFLKTILSALAKQALLQFLVCALACANCKCACF
jgi:hypothetical protein